MTSITSQKTQEELLRIIAFVKKKDDGRVFCDPVDVVALGLHDYHTIVLNPMDLSTVEVRSNIASFCLMLQKKLRAKSYQTMDAFVADVAQIWKNSELFNGATHSVCALHSSHGSAFVYSLDHFAGPRTRWHLSKETRRIASQPRTSHSVSLYAFLCSDYHLSFLQSALPRSRSSRSFKSSDYDVPAKYVSSVAIQILTREGSYL